MTVELLLEHFHRLGEAAEAIPRLRALIIDLAVKGKLTVSECSADDAVHTARALKLGMSKITDAIQRTRWAASSEVQPEEERFDAPVGWLWARLNDTGLYVNGVAFKPSDWQAKGLPIIRIQNLSNPSAAINYTSGEYDEANLAPPGTLLVSWSATLDAFIWERETAVVNQHIFRVFPNEAALDKRFLYWLLKDAIKILEAGEDMRGLTMRHIRRGPFLDFPVAIPPLPEQHRIVAKVEELMALCDRLEAAQQQREAERTRLTAAAWQAVVQAEAPAEVSFALEQLPALTTRPAQVKALRQTILDLAVRGRLVEQVEGDEPAEVLLERISKEKERLVREGQIRRQKPLPDTSRDQAPFDTPDTWEWSMLGAVSIITQGFAFASGDFSENVADGPPLIKIGDIANNEPSTFIRGTYDPEYIVQPGELLLGLSGSIKCAPWLGPPALLNQRIAKIVPVPNGIDEHWLVFCVQKSIEIWISETSKLTVQNVKAAQLYEAYVPVPPLAEQRRIVAKVEELMALCDGLEGTLAASETLRGKVLEAVVRSDDQMIGRSDNGPRPEVVQKPKVRVPRYVEPEEEMELAVAAEPVGSYGATQVVAKRGPGRPRKSAPEGNTQVDAMIKNYLHAHPGWHGKAAILEATGVDAGAWNAAIKALLEAGKVERQGEKKGARYRGR